MVENVLYGKQGEESFQYNCVSVVLGYWIISQMKKNELKEKRKENPNDVSLLNYGSFHPSF